MANGKKQNGKWVDRWHEGGVHRTDHLVQVTLLGGGELAHEVLLLEGGGDTPRRGVVRGEENKTTAI